MQSDEYMLLGKLYLLLSKQYFSFYESVLGIEWGDQLNKPKIKEQYCQANFFLNCSLSQLQGPIS